MAADLKQESDLKVQTIKGGLGELSVSIDGSKVVDGNRLWYSTPGAVIKKVRSALGK